MIDIEKYLYEVNRILEGAPYLNNNYDILYRSTNEVLNDILTQYNFNDKTVLSVMASSDQVFSSYYLGAKSVDTFDRNKLTYPYFYLRKWCLEYTKKSYLSADNLELLESLELHENDLEEELIAKFWKKILEQMKTSIYYSYLFHNPSYYYNLPYEKEEDKLIQIMQKKKANFTCFNLFEKQKFEKKYDIIILSNMLEYARDYDNYDAISEIICSNLEQLLNDNGIAICTNITGLGDEEDNSCFLKHFTLKNGIYGRNHFFGKKVPISYTYQKKKK